MRLRLAEFTLQTERDASWAAQRARLLGSLAGLSSRRRAALATATRLAARRILSCRGQRTVSFGFGRENEQVFVETVVRVSLDQADRAAVDSLQQQLAGDASDTNQPALSRLVDCAEVATDAHGGVATRLAQNLPPGSAPPAPAVAKDWSMVLTLRSPQNALVESQTRIHELATRVDEAQRRGASLERELQEVRTLNETLELLALVASKTENAVIILDARGAVEWVNDGFTRITGHELPDVKGALLGRVLQAGAEPSEDALDIDQSLQAGHAVSGELRSARRDGSSIWVSVGLTPVFDDRGAATRWIGIANDITRHREAQATLARAKDAAEAANRAKSEFLANISHEIRTPMNAVIGMTDMALDTPLTPVQRDYLTTVKSSAESLLSLLNDILDFSKIEAGKLEIEAAPLSLIKTVDDTLKPLAVRAAQRGLALRWEVRPDTPQWVLGDAARIRQVLLNLVDNAIKFTPQGEVAVVVEPLWRDAREVGLHLAVRDTGIGLAADKLQRIFEAFTQADSSTTRRFGGTGLGLTISSKLAQLMGGRIWVDSEYGQGSTFHFTLGLKLLDGVLPIAAPQLASSERPPREPACLPLKVLVADDNQANRVLASRILAQRGHAVMEAVDGRQAVELATRQAFDVILMDVQMPAMDGFESTAAIRQAQEPGGQRTPVIAMTAHAMKGDRERCLAAGMDAYIAKPIRTKELVSLVETVAAGATRGEQAAASDDATAPCNLAAALQRLEGDTGILREQIKFYLDDSPTLASDIQRAIVQRDGERLRRAAHRLRGLAAGFDAADVVAAAAQLETAGREGAWRGVEGISRQLAAHLACLQETLRQHLAR